MKTPLVVANWKMNHGPAATLAWLEAARGVSWPSANEVELAVAPPLVSLPALAAARGGSPGAWGVAAQCCHEATHGAYTGEVAASMLAELGVRYVLVGHSERREMAGETDARVGAKAVAVWEAGMVPLVCVGESLATRDRGKTLEFVQQQLAAVCDALGERARDAARWVVAYEPIWAIGTGRTATPQQAQEVHAAIRAFLAARLGAAASELRLLYGGSVNAKNAGELLACADIDGALVGGASLKVADFHPLVVAAAGARKVA